MPIHSETSSEDLLSSRHCANDGEHKGQKNMAVGLLNFTLVFQGIVKEPNLMQ